jgi:hypothetical protein
MVCAFLLINGSGYPKRAATFEWGTPDYKDTAVRVEKPILLLENGAKYEGEW